MPFIPVSPNINPVHGGYPAAPAHPVSGSVYYGNIGGSAGTYSLSDDADSSKLHIPASSISTVIFEGRYDDTIISKEPRDKLAHIHLLTSENGERLTLTLVPEKDITVWEMMQINTLLLTELHQPESVHICHFVRANNLERHFTFSIGHKKT